MIGLLILIGLIGQIAHWGKKWSRGEIETDLKTYIMTHKKHTIGSVITTVVAIVGLFSSTEVLVMSSQTMALSFFAGYSADSAINK